MSQASHEFKGSVDFNQNELRNATFQRLITPPISPIQGQIYYNTTIENPFFWDNIKWRPFGLPAVHIKYVNESTMFGNQTSQIQGYIYHDQNLDVYYEYLGTTIGDITDYNFIGGQHTHPASQILFTKLGASTLENLQEIHNLTRTSGHLDGGTITDISGGNVSVSAGKGFIRGINNDTSKF